MEKNRGEGTVDDLKLCKKMPEYRGNFCVENPVDNVDNYL